MTTGNDAAVAAAAAYHNRGTALHLVRYSDCNGDSMDLFVVAGSAREAAEGWWRHWRDFELEADPEAEGEETPEREVMVHTLPDSAATGAIAWDGMPRTAFRVLGNGTAVETSVD